MKKLILSAAIVLGSLSTFAQSSTVKKVEKIETTTKVVKEKFTQIKSEEVPEAVQVALKKAYPVAVIEKAFVNEKKEFKLDIKNGDQKATVYADADGNWIKK
jgi:primosomal protein N'